MQTVTDDAAWRKTLQYWAGNDYRPGSIAKMLDYYATHKPERPPISFGGPAPVEVPGYKCDLCRDTGTVMRPKVGGRYEWELEDVPCECAKQQSLF